MPACGPEHVLPVKRHESECQDPHPVYAAMKQHRVSRSFARDEVRQVVIPAYMGLISRLMTRWAAFQHLEDSGLADETMIIFTSITATIWAITGWAKKNIFMMPQRVCR